MIDTIWPLIPLTESNLTQIKTILSNRDKWVIALLNGYRNETKMMFHNGEISEKTEKYSRNINFSVPDSYEPDKTYLKIMCSLPKYTYGHNISLLYDWVSALQSLKNLFEAQFSVELPDVLTWKLRRVDVCYAHRFPNQDLAQLFLNSLKGLEFPYKKPTVRNTSITYQGTTYSLTFYLKKPEFFAHDRKELLKANVSIEWLNQLEAHSEGVFRSEARLNSYWLRDNHIKTVADLLEKRTQVSITYDSDLSFDEKEKLRHKLVAILFAANEKGIDINKNIKNGKRTLIKDGELFSVPSGILNIDTRPYSFPGGKAIFNIVDKPTSILQAFLDKFLGANRGMSNKHEVFAKLKGSYSQAKAISLFGFWQFVQSFGQKAAKTEFNKRTYYYNVAELKKAGISFVEQSDDLLDHEFLNNFRLEIPSPYVVNRIDEPCIDNLVVFPNRSLK